MVDFGSVLPFGDDWKLWEFELVHNGSPGVTVIDDSVYVSEKFKDTDVSPGPLDGGDADPHQTPMHLYSVNAQTGEEEWKFDQGGQFTAPVVTDDRVFVMGHSLESEPAMNPITAVFAVDSETGELDWRVDFDEHRWQVSPTVYGDTVFAVSAGNGNATLAALDIETGEPQWQATPGPTPLSPVYSDGRVFVTLKGWGVLAYDADTGELLWKQAIDEDALTDPTAVGDRVYVSGDDYYGFNPATGQLELHNEGPDLFALTEETLYFGENTDEGISHLQAFDRQTEQREWGVTLEQNIKEITPGDQLVYVLEEAPSRSTGSLLTGVSTHDGEVVFRRETGARANGVTVVGGTAYVSSNNKTLAAETQTNDWGQDYRTYRQVGGHHERNVDQNHDAGLF